MGTMQVQLDFYLWVKIYYGALHLDILLQNFAIHIIGALHLTFHWASLLANISARLPCRPSRLPQFTFYFLVLFSR